MNGWIQTAIGVLIGGLLSWAIAYYWGRDARKQRAKGNRLLQHQSETIHKLHGFLQGIKGSTTIDEAQINDLLEFIKDQAAKFKAINAGGS